MPACRRRDRLWDPTYTEMSWISQWGVGNGPGAFGQVKLLPRVQQDIDVFKPGTKIAITEYNYGGTDHISGGVAQADVLGDLRPGRRLRGVNVGVCYSDGNSQFASGAFKMYLDYDGASGDGQFGDLSITARHGSDRRSPPCTRASIPTTPVAHGARRDQPHERGQGRRRSRSRTISGSTGRGLPAHLGQRRRPCGRRTSRSTWSTPFIYTMPAYSVSTLVLQRAARRRLQSRRRRSTATT